MKRGPELLQPPGDHLQLPLQPVSGREALATAVIEAARQKGIDIVEDKELLAALASVEGEEQIPRELYAAMATVLSWVEGLKDATPKKTELSVKPAVAAKSRERMK